MNYTPTAVHKVKWGPAAKDPDYRSILVLWALFNTLVSIGLYIGSSMSNKPPPQDQFVQVKGVHINTVNELYWDTTTHEFKCSINGYWIPCQRMIEFQQQ